jgi:hypothetical protein
MREGQVLFSYQFGVVLRSGCRNGNSDAVFSFKLKSMLAEAKSTLWKGVSRRSDAEVLSHDSRW